VILSQCPYRGLFGLLRLRHRYIQTARAHVCISCLLSTYELDIFGNLIAFRDVLMSVLFS